MFKFSGMQSKKLESWKCCIKTSNEYNTVNHFLSNLVRKNRYVERITKKSNNLYTIITNTQTQNNEYYTVVFTVNKNDNTIIPLFMIPYPCNKKDKCENITKIKT